ncbi:hypothetical protein JW859_11300 [bacterium]|nr:hypothetical protein [bacterium]
MRRAWSLLLAFICVGPAMAAAPMHPDIALLDDQGGLVIATGRPVSPLTTCGQCHDTDYIALYNCHAWAGFNEACKPGAAVSGRSWDTGPGLYGRLDLLDYSLPLGDGERFTRGVADWIKADGWRHVGGGPAALANDGTSLLELPLSDDLNAASYSLDPVTNQPVPWDWRESGIPELNCFICHLAEADNLARVAALTAGAFGWAATATLGRTAVVTYNGRGWDYNSAAFDSEGKVSAKVLGVTDPTAENCGLCHAPVYYGEAPLYVVPELHLRNLEATGEIFSPQRPSQSALNLAGKESLNEPWDVHAERLLDCVSCHYSTNNPAYYGAEDGGDIEHLRFDTRVLEIGEYLKQPSHVLAKGYSSTLHLGDQFDGTMRDCNDCHDLAHTHEWLPYKDRHFSVLMCQACHIPELHAPARQMTDWTVVDDAGRPRVSYRGIDGPVDDPAALITNYQPLLIMRETPDGRRQYGPFNVMASWYWVAGEPPVPVPLALLDQALRTDVGYQPDILEALDTDQNGTVDPAELRLDTPAKAVAVASRLAELGLEAPRIIGELQPYGINHGVVSDQALRDCAACHGPDSRLDRSFTLSADLPGGVVPRLVGDANVVMAGVVAPLGDNYVYRQQVLDEGHYVLGAHRWPWADGFGLLAVVLVILGVAGHTLLRWVAHRRNGRAQHE